MKYERLENWHVFWNSSNKFSKLDMDGGYMGNKYPLYVILNVQLLKKGASYWRHGNTPIPDHMKYNTQCYDDTTIQHFMGGDS